MDLAELQERYPHGSRWQYRQDVRYFDRLSTLEGQLTPPFTVLGWHEGRATVILEHADGMGFWEVASCDLSLERIPDPPLCPITEPVMLSPYEDRPTTEVGWASHVSGNTLIFGPPTITLHPEGVEPPDGLPWAKYTWGTP